MPSIISVAVAEDLLVGADEIAIPVWAAADARSRKKARRRVRLCLGAQTLPHQQRARHSGHRFQARYRAARPEC